MPTLDDLVDEQNRIASELQRMADDPEATEDGQGNLRDTLIQRWEEIEPERKRLTAQLEKLNIIKRQAQHDANLESGDGGGTPWTGGNRGPEFMQRMDPFADMDAIREGRVRGDEMVARAQNMLEADDKRHLLPGDRGETASHKAQSPSIARHMLQTGSPEYLAAFRNYLNNPIGYGELARTALTTGTATAGFLLPYVLDTSIILSNSGSVNPYRRISRVENTTANAWQGVSGAGVGVAWVDEGTQATDTGSAVGQVQIITSKAAAWVTGSFELMSDTDYASQLPGLLADAKDIAEEAVFALGTGAAAGPNTGQPQGVAMGLTATQRITPAAVGTAGGSFYGTAGVADVYNLNGGLGPRFRLSPNVAWVANIATINRIRSLDQYGGSSFWVNLNQDQPERLLGKPVYESPSLISIGTGGGTAVGSATAIFGDFSKYIIVDRVGTTMLFDPLLKSTGTPNIPSGTQGWFYFWRVGAKVAVPNAFRWIGNS